jgi:hypothetical protein
MIADLAIILLIVSVPLFAHHGNAAFDNGKKLTVTGWTWGNPHIYLKFEGQIRQNPDLSDKRFRSAARGDLKRFLLRLLVLDQLTEAVGNVQTHSASREEYESDQPDHWTHEFFGTDSAWMLKHAHDGEGQERPQNNAQDSCNYKDDFPDHEGPPGRTASDRVRSRYTRL